MGIWVWQASRTEALLYREEFGPTVFLHPAQVICLQQSWWSYSRSLWTWIDHITDHKIQADKVSIMEI